MRRFLRPRTKTFRVMLSLALLAWTSLSFGALVWPMSAAGATAPSSSMQAMSSHVTVAQRDGMPMAHTALNHSQVPVMPMGQSGCCHGGCHCPSACGVAVIVSRPLTVQEYAQAPLPALESANPALALITPPLRPPII